MKPCTSAATSHSVPLVDNVGSLMLCRSQEQQTVFECEDIWLQMVLESLNKGNWPAHASWAAYHAEQSHASKDVQNVQPAVIALLPLFGDSAHSFAMIKHGMECISKAVHKLNGSQAPVIAFDQPLYAMAKLIQWSEPEKFGEDQIVLLLGALHIEMAAWKTLGDWLAGSGWTDALEHAGVASSGTADSFLKACHVKRTRQAHIVTLASLYVLRYRAYERYRETELDDLTTLDFQAWCDSRISECRQFTYWNSVLDLELTVVSMVRAVRTRNFDLYCRSLVQLAPWFFCTRSHSLCQMASDSHPRHGYSA